MQHRQCELIDDTIRVCCCGSRDAGGAEKPAPRSGGARARVGSTGLHSPGGPGEAHRHSFVCENILENLLDGVMSVGLDGRVMIFNPAAARMPGCRRDDVVGHTPMEAFLAVEGLDDFNQAILDAVAEHDRTERKVVEANAGGEPRSFSMTTSYLASPDAGEPIGVEESLLAEGQGVAKGDTLLAISDVDRMAVVAPVDEVEVPSIRPGQPVTVRGDAFPGLEVRGTVTHVSPEPRASTPGEAPRFEVQVSLDDPGDRQRERMRTGMSAHLRIATCRNSSALMLPSEAPSGSGEASVVRVLDEATGVLQERTVEPGLATLDKVEVIGGLQAGEIVAPRGN